mmetsp:Transcript_23894/g.76852  ORF Transcript_23894/g.76852 Transcript_23894/m.76852 type:complete len:452 (-) Transcript_23894:1454-2809(-)
MSRLMREGVPAAKKHLTFVQALGVVTSQVMALSMVVCVLTLAATKNEGKNVKNWFWLGGLGPKEDLWKWHPVLMTFALVFMMEGLLAFRMVPLGSYNVGFHVLSHTFSVLCIAFGLAAIFHAHNKLENAPGGAYSPNLATPHAVVGVAVVSCALAQYAAGFLAFLGLDALRLPNVTLWKDRFLPNHVVFGIFLFAAFVLALVAGVAETYANCSVDFEREEDKNARVDVPPNSFCRRRRRGRRMLCVWCFFGKCILFFGVSIVVFSRPTQRNATQPTPDLPRRKEGRKPFLFVLLLVGKQERQFAFPRGKKHAQADCTYYTNRFPRATFIDDEYDHYDDVYFYDDDALPTMFWKLSNQYVLDDKDANPAENYGRLPGGCKAAFGVVVTALLTLLSVLVAVLSLKVGKESDHPDANKHVSLDSATDNPLGLEYGRATLVPPGDATSSAFRAPA